MYRIADWLLNSRRRRRRSVGSKRASKANFDHTVANPAEHDPITPSDTRQPPSTRTFIHHTPTPQRMHTSVKFSELDDYYLSFQRIRLDTPQLSSAPPSTQLRVRNPSRLDIPASDYANMNRSIGRPAIRTNPWVAPRSPNSPNLEWQVLSPSPVMKTPEKLFKPSTPHPADDLSSSGYSSHDSSPESSLYSPRWAVPTKPTAFVPLAGNRRSIAEQERSIDISYENICEVILEEVQSEKVDKSVECTIDEDEASSVCGECEVAVDGNGNKISDTDTGYLSDEAVFLLAELDRKLFDLRARTRQVAVSTRRAEDEYQRYERSKEIVDQNLSALRRLKWVIHGTDLHI